MHASVRAHSLIAVSWLLRVVGNGMPRKFGLLVLLDKKIIEEVLKVTETWIESPKVRGLAQVVGAVQPEQVAVPVPSEVPLSLTVTVNFEPQPLVIVGEPLATMYDATSLGVAH